MTGAAPPRDNGSRDAEIVRETGAMEPGRDPVSEQLLISPDFDVGDSLDFDVGGVDQLTLRLDHDGAAEKAFLTP